MSTVDHQHDMDTGPDPLHAFLSNICAVHEEVDRALAEGDPELNLALWSTREPVSLFGAAFSGVGRGVLTAKLAIAGSWFASTSGYRLEVVNAGVSGDLAYLVGFEHRTIDAAGAGVPHTLRVTFIYRREASQWKLIHRHSDVASTDVTRAQGESRLTSERDVLARTRRRG